MLDQKPLNKLLFIDIETTSQKENFTDLTEHQQYLFRKRFKKDIESEIEKKISLLKIAEKINKDDLEVEKTTKKLKGKKVELSTDTIEEKITQEVLQQIYDIKGPIHCEFSRVLCISCGVLWKNEGEDFYYIKIISFYDEDEKKLLSDFINHPKLSIILDKAPEKFEKNRGEYWALVGHNLSIFDVPVLSKRMIINGIKPPKMFDVSHLKSWDLADVIIDTKSAWSYNVFDNSTSLELLCEVFNVESPKDGISGADVKDVFYKEKDLEKIARYCERDVYALCQVYIRMKSMPEEVRIYCPPTQKTEE